MLMPAATPKNPHPDHETARRGDARKELEGMTLDLDKLRQLYPDRGCRVRVVIMEASDSSAGARTRARQPLKEHRIYVPPSRTAGTKRRTR
jgi:hypothetical protein